MAVSSDDVSEEHLLNQIVAQGSLDFDSWTMLISSVEQMYPDEINKVNLVYDSFLSEFPLCRGYWKKYAEHVARLCSPENTVQIFERAVESMPYSVGVWVDYCSFGISSFEDPLDVCRLFERGLSFVRKDYLCHNLWDKYIKFEYSHEHWNSLARIYIQTLEFPTKKLHQYYESFKKLVAIWKEDMEFQKSSQKKEQAEDNTDSETVASEDVDISHVINGLMDPSTRAKSLLKYISVGESFYKRACDLNAKVHKFEQNISRPYFHVKPLDDSQLLNWHCYLDLVEMEGDFDWAVKLYERCLVSCAHYPEFWMRYVDYVESKGGREIAIDALKRATQIFLKNVPEIHLFNAWFKEKISDVDGAHAAFVQCDEDFGPCFVDRIKRKANKEKRMGNYVSAFSVYEEALDVAAEIKPDTLPMLYVHFAHLQYVITNSVEATREILLKGIQRVPHSKLLLKELIRFALMHGGATQVDLLDSVMAQALAIGTDVPGGLSNKDREEISRLYLEFIDFCGSINDIRRAWNRHLKLFPHLVRVQPTLKKPDNAGAICKVIVDGRPDSLNTELIVEEKADKFKQDDQSKLEGGNSSPNDMDLGTSEATKTIKDECKTNDSAAGPLCQASDEKNPEKVLKDSRTHVVQKVQEQDRRSQPGKPDSLEGHSLNSQDESHKINASLSQGLETPREASLSNASTRAGGHESNEIPSISSPVGPRENNASEACNESACPSSRTDHPSEKEGNQRHINSYGKGRSRFGSPRSSIERPERSLSPRRRNAHLYSDDRRRRERSLSPRRRNSRWQPEDRWQRDRRNRRFSRYQDNSRGQRDGRMQNNSLVVVGNTGQMQNAQQQSNVAYPQAPTNQYPLPGNEQYGNVQSNQLYNNMWQYYYYNQQQQLPLQQTALGSQQVQPSQQLQQPMQNPDQQQLMQTPQQPQQIPPNQQQLLNLPYQQQQLYQQVQLQPQLTNEQPESQQQQLRSQQQISQQQLYVQLQPQQQLQQQVHIQQQTKVQQQDEVYLQQQQQQQQQSYQYQQVQQQQYLLYLQQLQQYQQSQIAEELPKELPEFEHRNDKSQIQQDNDLTKVDSVGCLQQKTHASTETVLPKIDLIHSYEVISKGQGLEHLNSGAPTQDELPEIEGTDV